MTDAHSAPSTVPIFHIHTLIIIKSDSTSSNHLSLGLPCLLPPPGLLSSNYFTVLPSLILTTSLIHSNLRTLITDTIPGGLNLLLISWYMSKGPVPLFRVQVLDKLIHTVHCAEY
jgi:hypothetical protein